jgi:Tfp pilus assembly protein PilF
MWSGGVTSTDAPPWVYAAAGVLGVALLALGLPPVASAQAGSSTIDVSVRVTDVNNEQPINMARIELLQFPERFVRQGVSDSNGQVEFSGVLSHQSYVLRVSKDGYLVSEMEFDTVRGERSKRLYISLRPIEKKGPTAPGDTVSAQKLAAPPKAVKEFREGLKLFNERKDAQGSLGYFRKAISIWPKYAEAHCMMGLAHLQLQALDDAEKSFVRAMELEPRLLQPYHPLATILITRRRFEEAEKILHRALDIDPKGWQWPFELARSQAMQRNWEKATVHGKQALAAANVPTKIHLLMADIYSSAGQVELAAAELDEFEKLDPQSLYMPKVRAARAQLKKPTP